MGLLLLLVTLTASAAVIALGVWGMVRVEVSLGEPEESVLAHWAEHRRASGAGGADAGRPLTRR